MVFVDAAQPGHFRPGKARNYLDPENLDAIVVAYAAFADAPRFAHVADLAEIEANNWNLNICRYVDTTVEVEQVDIAAALTRLRELERERDAAAMEMDGALAERGYA